MMLCNSAGLEKAAKYGCCRNQPLVFGESDEAGAEVGDCGALILVQFLVS